MTIQHEYRREEMLTPRRDSVVVPWAPWLGPPRRDRAGLTSIQPSQPATSLLKKETPGGGGGGGDRDRRCGQEAAMSSGSISSDSEMLMEEIISLRRERKDIMESLTPRISCWRDQISGAAISSFHKMDSSTIKPASSFQSDSQQQVYLTDDFDVLEDVEDLGQRMLSLAHSLSTSHAPISLYKADELVSTASKLERISLDFYNSTEAAMKEAADEERDRMMEIRKTEGEGTAEELDEEMEMGRKMKRWEGR
ncbi:hypothetical protein CFC21_032148 [Triticum aestivum]|uniref:Uncharacterized protein n=2 Tax=Triticum aestivum TaxID=4565 RepID=A0A9R1EZG1_WHEAT|nr:hypothetical protein CFC21_032148 [Triticum aestivum]